MQGGTAHHHFDPLLFPHGYGGIKSLGLPAPRPRLQSNFYVREFLGGGGCRLLHFEKSGYKSGYETPYHDARLICGAAYSEQWRFNV